MATSRDIQDKRGRVVLRMRGIAPTQCVLETAVRVTRTFHGELRGIFVRDEDLLALAGMPFAREISLSGGHSRALSPDTVQRELATATATTRRSFERLVRQRGIAARFDIVAGATESIPPEAADDVGILVVGEPLALAATRDITAVLSASPAAAGVIVTGPATRRHAGPVLAIVDGQSDPALLADTAERLAREAGSTVNVLLTHEQGPTSSVMTAMSERVVAAIDPRTLVRIDRTGALSPRALAAWVDRYQAGLVVAQVGGAVAATGRDAARFAVALTCPLLLMRGRGDA